MFGDDCELCSQQTKIQKGAFFLQSWQFLFGSKIPEGAYGITWATQVIS